MQQAAEGEFGGWRSAMEETDDRYDEYLDGEYLDGDPRTQQSTVRAQKTKGQYCFFCSLFKFFFSPSSDILPFLLLI